MGGQNYQTEQHKCCISLLMCDVSNSNLIDPEWNHEFIVYVTVSAELCLGRFMLKVKKFQGHNRGIYYIKR